MNALKYFYLESKRQILDNPEGVIKSLACAIGITTVVRYTEHPVQL
jgi:hypothetical protein